MVSGASTEPAFEIRAVRVEVGDRPLLTGVDLRIGVGERVALVGPSGAGKTTLLRLLGAGLPAARGSVRALGREVGSLAARELRALRAEVGFVHQDHSLVPNLRVLQNVVSGSFGRRGLGSALRAFVAPARGDLERAHALLERLGIANKLYQRTDTLSGGERQRVAVARALFQRPLALLADEPVASVDPTRSRALIELLVQLASEQGLTLVASLHDLELARDYFPRVVGLRAGRVAFDRPGESVTRADWRALYRLDDAGARESAWGRAGAPGRAAGPDEEGRT